jgi:hypothetical protein
VAYFQPSAKSIPATTFSPQKTAAKTSFRQNIPEKRPQIKKIRRRTPKYFSAEF